MKTRKPRQTVSDRVRHDKLEAHIRAFVPPPKPRKLSRKRRQNSNNQSDWALVYDTESTTDAAQSLRFGVYQVYNGQQLHEQGIFYDPDTLSASEQSLLQAYAAKHGFKLRTKAEFVDEIFYGTAYDLRATIVGFNLPFDLARCAVRHGPARGKTMRGGFTLQLSEDGYKPRVQLKHISARNALIQFTKPRRRLDTRRMRKQGMDIPPRRGAFIDVKTIAAAHFSRSFTLGELAEFSGIRHRKLSTDEHGGPLTEAYIDYAVRDVLATWECHCLLSEKFDTHGLSQSRLSQILSEASLGKAHLKEMGIRPWREMQPDFPDRLNGIIMSTYYGGRAEVHLRRVNPLVVYCDFLSMYPSACTLMHLWPFVIAKGIKWRENTKEVRKILKHIDLDELQKPKTWKKLKTLIQVLPDDDIFPVRANYGSGPQATIGLNYVKSRTPLWYTLADCIASKLLTGKCPKIQRAITFEPKEAQDDLKPMTIAGGDHRVDPRSDDFFKCIIDRRNEVKEKLKSATGPARDRLDSEQLALKILANATSYGIFVELNVEELEDREQRLCYGPNGKPFPIWTTKGEEPGRYFHPLLATLITGAARLMLAITETLAIKHGLNWAFCDTDSMAFAKPETMDQRQFVDAVQKVCDWFVPLNPYNKKGSLLKIEDANYQLRNGKRTNKFAPLYCLAISAKRYVLFNLNQQGRPIIRKASAHGLGQYLAPYKDKDAPKSIPKPQTDLKTIGVDRWQYDLWYQIICAVVDGHPDQVDLSYHPNLKLPAACRYGATSPRLLKWFESYNKNRSYGDQVKPFNFMIAFQAKPILADDADIELVVPQDCYADNYNQASTNGSARTDGDCPLRVVRGGSWTSPARDLRSATRKWDSSTDRYNWLGFRIGRTLSQ